MRDRNCVWMQGASTIAAMTLLSLTPARAAAWTLPGVTITERVEFPVTLSDDQDYTLVGTLSMKVGGGCGLLHNRTLQVALHGGTYDHAYWDAPTIGGEAYSYADYMTERCFGVLALDMLGAGESDAPPGDFADLAASAIALEQVLASVRDAGIGCLQPFDRIALVGHSMGTITSVYTLGAAGPVADALVATGWAHAPRIIPIDPAAFEGPLQEPYVAFPDEVRAQLFYHPPTADPAVIAYDNESLVSPLPRGLLLDVLDMMGALAVGDPAQIKALTLVDEVEVPVLVQLGEFDLIAASAVADAEAAYYSSAPDVTVQVLSDIGHDFNLHLNREIGWAQIDAWLTATLGK